MRLLRGLLWAVVIEAALVGLVWVCARYANTDRAWQLGLLVVATLPLVGFATRERS